MLTNSPAQPCPMLTYFDFPETTDSGELNTYFDFPEQKHTLKTRDSGELSTRLAWHFVCYFIFGFGFERRLLSIQGDQGTEGCMGEQATLEFDTSFGDVLLHKLVKTYKFNMLRHSLSNLWACI